MPLAGQINCSGAYDCLCWIGRLCKRAIATQWALTHSSSPSIHQSFNSASRRGLATSLRAYLNNQLPIVPNAKVYRVWLSISCMSVSVFVQICAMRVLKLGLIELLYMKVIRYPQFLHKPAVHVRCFGEMCAPQSNRINYTRIFATCVAALASGFPL